MHIAGKRVNSSPGAGAPEKLLQRFSFHGGADTVGHAVAFSHRIGNQGCLRIDKKRKIQIVPGGIKLRHIHQIKIVIAVTATSDPGKHIKHFKQREGIVVIVIKSEISRGTAV